MCFAIAFSWVFAKISFMSIMATLGPENLASSAKADDLSTMMVTATVTAERGASCVPGKEEIRQYHSRVDVGGGKESRWSRQRCLVTQLTMASSMVRGLIVEVSYSTIFV
jgi:hypothetical protein